MYRIAQSYATVMWKRLRMLQKALQLAGKLGARRDQRTVRSGEKDR